MAAPFGNDFHLKFKTPEAREALCEAWCQHRIAGKAKESFIPCDHKTLERYARDYPDEFPSEKLEEAERRYFEWWEDVGRRGIMGEIAGFNAPTFIFNLKNRFGWRDKSETTTTVQGPDGGPVQLVSTGQLERMAKAYLVTNGGSESSGERAGEE